MGDCRSHFTRTAGHSLPAALLLRRLLCEEEEIRTGKQCSRFGVRSSIRVYIVVCLLKQREITIADTSGDLMKKKLISGVDQQLDIVNQGYSSWRESSSKEHNMQLQQQQQQQQVHITRPLSYHQPVGILRRNNDDSTALRSNTTAAFPLYNQTTTTSQHHDEMFERVVCSEDVYSPACVAPAVQCHVAKVKATSNKCKHAHVAEEQEEQYECEGGGCYSASCRRRERQRQRQRRRRRSHHDEQHLEYRNCFSIPSFEIVNHADQRQTTPIRLEQVNELVSPNRRDLVKHRYILCAHNLN